MQHFVACIDVLGRDGSTLTFAQMAVRTILVFCATLALLRVANRRFLGRYAAFDAVLAIILGSVVSRGINGSAPFWPTLGAATILMALHWIAGWMAFHSFPIRRLLKGTPVVLFDSDRSREDNMRRSHITESDLLEDLRYEAQISSLTEVHIARLECNGRISVIPKQSAHGG